MALGWWRRARLHLRTLLEDHKDELFVGGSGALLCEGAGL